MAPLTGYPTLQPAFIFTATVGEGNHVGTVANGSTYSHFTMPTGKITTVEGFEPKFEADIVFAADALHHDPDGENSRINVTGVAKTAAGVAIGFGWTGVANVDDQIRRLFTGHPEAKTTAFGNMTANYTFEAGHADYKFLENASWVGNGRFKVDEGKLGVEFRVSKVVSSTDMD